MTDCVVRRFQNEDAQEVSDLIIRTLRTSNIKDYSAEYIENDVKMFTPDGVIERAGWTHFYVVCDKECIVGCGAIGSYWGKEDESSLFNIFVLPEYQGKGVGRKIIVDTYGGVGKVGGGCFSSKNATKVDRSGAYYARYVAKNIVAHDLAERCEIQVSYGIGIEKPLSMYIETFGTERVDVKEIYKYVEKNFDFTVGNIIKELDLLKPKFKQTACYGHFGWDEYSWERIKL